ncbi:MAG: tetratricopeptide repeat protein [Thermodesulfobacteriota bacterium]
MSSQHQSISPAPQRLVRVFVSSTFRDMQEERDYLATHVFPELRHRCRQRQVEFVEVDLRWGITEEQANRGEVLPTCLAEIENCRPYFIGLLGERYGWVPDFIHPELVNEQPWLEEHKEKSVTELEILHGVLNNPAMADRSFFYFRDPTYVQTVSEELRSDFLSEDAPSQVKLEKLKERIRKSSLSVKEDYPDPEAAGKLILDDLWAAIDKAFPEDQPPDPLDQEAAEHEAFAQSRAKVYIAREEYYQRLDEHVAAEEGPQLCLIGESGGGKSALLANWASRYREAHPDAFLIMHFIGSSPGSTDYAAIIRRIMGEIKRRYDVPDEIPAAPDKIKEAFPFWLAIASAKGGLLLVLDGLNQLEDRDYAPHLGWLPDYNPPKVRIIVSALPGSALDAIHKRECPTLVVAPLSREEVGKLVVDYLAQYRKALGREQVERIADATATSNPLYLRALLEELRIFGIFEELDDKVSHYLEATTIPELYDKILERMEEDFEEHCEHLVGDAMSFLWASRRGLFESELLELLGDSDKPLPRSVWSPLFLALQESLISRSGLVNFFHDYLRQAVTKRYLAQPDAQKARHIRLGNYFEKRDTDERKADELPWQLFKAEQWERLKTSITEVPMFLSLSSGPGMLDLIGYWVSLGQLYDIEREHDVLFKGFEENAPSQGELAFLSWRVAKILDLSSKLAGAERYYGRTLAVLEQSVGPSNPEVISCISALASVVSARGRYDEAEELDRRALKIAEETYGLRHQQTAECLRYLATRRKWQGDYPGALESLQKALSILQTAPETGLLDYAECLRELTDTLDRMGKFDEAESFMRQAVDITEKVRGRDDPFTGGMFRGLAGVLESKQQYKDAEDLLRRSLEISERALGPSHINTAFCLNDLGWVVMKQGKLEEAEQLYRRSIRIWHSTVGLEHPQTANSMSNLSQLLKILGKIDEAQDLCVKALEIRKNLLGEGHPDAARDLCDLATISLQKGDINRAEELLKQARDIFERTLGTDHLWTAASLHNLAGVYLSKGDLDKAEDLLRGVCGIYERQLGHNSHHAAVTSLSLARVLCQKGRVGEAERICRQGVFVLSKVLGQEHFEVAGALDLLATVLSDLGKYEEAEESCLRAKAIAEKTLGIEHQTTVGLGRKLETLSRRKEGS